MNNLIIRTKIKNAKKANHFSATFSEMQNIWNNKQQKPTEDNITYFIFLSSSSFCDLIL